MAAQSQNKTLKIKINNCLGEAIDRLDSFFHNKECITLYNDHVARIIATYQQDIPARGEELFYKTLFMYQADESYLDNSTFITAPDPDVYVAMHFAVRNQKEHYGRYNKFDEHIHYSPVAFDYFSKQQAVGTLCHELAHGILGKREFHTLIRNTDLYTPEVIQNMSFATELCCDTFAKAVAFAAGQEPDGKDTEMAHEAILRSRDLDLPPDLCRTMIEYWYENDQGLIDQVVSSQHPSLLTRINNGMQFVATLKR